MTGSWFITPAKVHKEMSDGGWIDIKERLTYGEQKRLETGAMGKLSGGTEEEPAINLDFEKYNITRLLTWIVAWSQQDALGQMIPIDRDSIAALHPDIATEIEDVLTAHIQELEDAKNAETPTDE